jgi:dynein heavy chain 1
VIIERLRYTPTGWSKRYEFSEGDLISSINTVDSLLNTLEYSENIQLEKIPFERVRNIVAINIYGGKIDNEFD